MRLDALFARQPRTLSFEFFPPKNERSWFTLEDSIEQLMPLGPDFVSVTYGAGGTTRAKTREVVEHLQQKAGVTAMAHLTCVNATRAELKALLDEYAAAGIENLLALRGDPPKGQERFTPTDGGCAHASDLIELIDDRGGFSTLCAAFPERHPDATSREADWEFLARKLEAGAIGAITQGFFSVEPYVEMMAWLTRRLGHRPRVIPGVWPVTGWKSVESFCRVCNAAVPEHLRALDGLDAVQGRQEGMRRTVQLCRALLAAGAPGLHLYAMNRSTAVAEITTALRLSGEI
jgi:methylenetetrahydrofolate reductase (NADPH)